MGSFLSDQKQNVDKGSCRNRCSHVYNRERLAEGLAEAIPSDGPDDRKHVACMACPEASRLIVATVPQIN